MLQRKSSLGYKIGLGFILSLFLGSLLAIVISGYLLKQNFDERSQQSSMLVSRFMASSISQYINRLTSGLDALNGDADLLRDVLGSLGSPEPKRKNFFKLFAKLEDFSRQYGLEQVSLYLKPMGRQEHVIFSTIVPRDNHIFTYSPENYGEDMVEIIRDEYGLVTVKDNGLNSFNFRFSNTFLGPEKKISLIRVDDKLYLDINYPLVNDSIGGEGQDNAFIRKGATYGVVRIAMPLPDSFITKMEYETGHRISFYNSQLKYIAGILEPNLDIPAQGSFTNLGIDGVEYLNYLSSVNFDGSELAKIVISFEKNILTRKIMNMIFMIFGVNIVSSGLLWGGLSLYLRRRVILPIQDLTGSVKAMTEEDLKSWKDIPAHALTSQSDELEILSQAFRNMGQQLDELVDNLEGKVKERTAAIVLEKHKTQEILNNIGVGIITFDDRLIVGDEYSRHMHALLELTPEKIRGASFQELILNRLDLSPDGHNTVYEILRGSLGMPPLSWEMNHGNLPTSLVVTIQGKRRYMTLDWYPMLNENGLVERGMLVIKDQTEKVLLQQDLEKSNERHECLSEIINVAMKYDMGYVLRFVERAHKQLTGHGIGKLMTLARSKPDDLFILLHTLKGDARTTGFKRIASKAHQAESLLHRIRGQAHEEDIAMLEEGLQHLSQELATFSDLLSHLFSRKSSTHAPSSCLINHLLPQFKEVVSILKDNGIRVGSFYYDDRIQDWCPENVELIKDMIMHALTNSIDHGYVLPKLAGESTAEYASLHIKADFEGDSAVIEIADEGQGFDLTKLRQKYQIDKSVSDQESLARLLQSGVTTASEITTLSGRGVGLNAILELSHRLGGSTQLVPNTPRGAKVRIILPRDAVVVAEDMKQVS